MSCVVLLPRNGLLFSRLPIAEGPDPGLEVNAVAPEPPTKKTLLLRQLWQQQRAVSLFSSGGTSPEKPGTLRMTNKLVQNIAVPTRYLRHDGSKTFRTSFFD